MSFWMNLFTQIMWLRSLLRNVSQICHLDSYAALVVVEVYHLEMIVDGAITFHLLCWCVQERYRQLTRPVIYVPKDFHLGPSWTNSCSWRSPAVSFHRQIWGLSVGVGSLVMDFGNWYLLASLSCRFYCGDAGTGNGPSWVFFDLKWPGLPLCLCWYLWPKFRWCNFRILMFFHIFRIQMHS